MQVRDFYSQVVGWRAEPVEMDGYADFNMIAPGTNQPAGGICHARGANAALPAQWLIYIRVADLEQALTRCQELGGRILVGPKAIDEKQRYVVIQDPAGAVAALIG